MRIEEGHIDSGDGTRLYTRTWWPDGRARGALVLVHGAGEHCGRYEHVAARLTGAGFTVFGFDLRGHGRSAGRRGHVNSFDEYVDDARAATARARTAVADGPLFLYGHSMGGLIATLTAARDPAPYRGMVITSPLFAAAVPVPPLLRAVASVLNVVYPTIGFKSGIPSTYLSHDAGVGQAYDADPLVGHTVTPRWFFAMNRACAEAWEEAPGITLPVLVMQAGDDHLVSAERTRQVFDRLPGPDKTFRLFDGFYHELHNEVQKEQALDMIVNWLVEHTRGEGD